MIHTMFGGNRHGNGSSWATLSKVSLLTGAANFLGGLPVLKHSVVKIAEFLHSQHSDKLTGLQLPQPDQALCFSHVHEICAKIEFLALFPCCPNFWPCCPCPVGCCPAETTAGQASTWGLNTPFPRPDTLGCCGGPNRAQQTVNSTG